MIVTLDCIFNRAIVNEKFHDNQNFKLKYIIDMNTNTAILTGNNGSAEVTFLRGTYGGFSFIEVTEGNYIMTTTIDANLKAVHSRHSVINGLFPQQFYGKCGLPKEIEQAIKRLNKPDK